MAIFELESACIRASEVFGKYISEHVRDAVARAKSPSSFSLSTMIDNGRES